MTPPTLVFASVAGGSVFMAELLEVVADAVRSVGGRAVTHTGPLPDRDDAVFVVVPHEYLVVTPAPLRPRPDQLRRTIGFLVEHPGTKTFEVSAALAGQLGGLVDINQESADELARRGHRPHRFALGYAPRWDAWGGDLDRPRPLDVTYLGTAERRRSRILAAAAPVLDQLSVRWLTPPHEPMTRPRPDFLLGRARREHLAGTRAIINLHRESSSALEWLRVLEAICNGCLVVSETSPDHAPLIPGRHLLMTSADGVGALTAALLGNPDVERRMRSEAYDFVRTELDMSVSATTLLELAAEIADRTVPPRSVALAEVTDVPAVPAAPDAEPPLAVDTPMFDRTLVLPAAAGFVSAAARAAALLQVSRVERAQRYGGAQYRPATIPFGGPRSRRAPSVDVLIVWNPGDPSLSPLLDDLALGRVVPGNVLVARDGAADPAGLGEDHLGVLRTPAPTGLGCCRNQLLQHSAAGLLLILGAEMRCAPGLLEQLLVVEDDVVHCPIVDADEGLIGALPMESRRLAALPYLGDGYLVRRDVIDEIGGWSSDPWAEGLTDHLFWTAVATAGRSATLVQRPLLSRSASTARRRPVDLDPVQAWQRAAGRSSTGTRTPPPRQQAAADHATGRNYAEAR